MQSGLPAAPSALFLLVFPLIIHHASCADAPIISPPSPSIAFYLFSAVIGTLVAKYLWGQRRPLLTMLGQWKKHDKKKEESKDNNNNSSASNEPQFNKKVADLEARIDQLQRTLKERDGVISDLKEKNVKQEKKIDDQTRARLVKEKDATIAELKERIRKQQQKKDDQTRARLSHPDSPVAKSVLDATLRENRDLHLRIEAMLLQAQEERKNLDTYRRDLAVAENKNLSLERELQAAKAETLRIQKMFAQIRTPMDPDFFSSATTSTTDIPSVSVDSSASISTSSSTSTTTLTTPTEAATSTDTTPVSANATPENNTPLSASDNATPVNSMPVDSSTQVDSTSSTTTPSSSATHTTQEAHTTITTPRANGITSSNVDVSSSSEGGDILSSPEISMPSTSSSMDDTQQTTTDALNALRQEELAEPESYDLSKLAKELDASALSSSPLNTSSPLRSSPMNSSLSELMDSLDSVPVQALDFGSLSHQASDTHASGGGGGRAMISPTARMERRQPFRLDSEYDQDFISMFGPPHNSNYNHVKVKVRHHSPALNNLFLSDGESNSVPSFNLEGIDGDFLSSNPDAETPTLSNPPISSHSLQSSNEAHAARFPSPAHSPKSPPSPTSPSSLPPYANPPFNDAPSRSSKGVHKSIFSVFGNDDMNGITEANGTTSPTSATPTPIAPLGHDELLHSFGSKVDTNKGGLRRAKKVNFAAFASKGKVKVEPTMEDVHFCIYPYMKSKQRALFAVFDGHAGRAAADEASALFPKEFNTQLELSSQNVSQAFLNTYAAVDDAMKEYEYMGTTATVVYLWQKEGKKFVQASNVGDSTAFLCRNGVSVRLTVDHKPSAAEEKERMRLAGIEISDNQTRINGLAVSRSLGNHFVKEQNIGMIATPYIGDRIEILPTDTHLIVASDGLWDVVNSQHAMDLIRGMDALPAASHLLSAALSSTKCNDNVSIIVVRLN